MRHLLFASFLTLTACVQPGPETSRGAQNLKVPENSCEAKATPICAFFNAPLVLLTSPIRVFLRSETFYPTAKDLRFVDSKKQAWVAPKGTLTDGASIPPLFVPLVGAPRSQEFVNAAAIHDAYCGAGNNKLAQYHSDTWQNVHRMFYDALRVGGTPPAKAKIMFAAVYLGGPRWKPSKQRQRVARSSTAIQFSTKSLAEPLRSRSGTSLQRRGISDKQLLAEMKDAIIFINTEKPSIATLERYLIKREIILDGLSNLAQSKDDPIPFDDFYD